MTNAVAGPRHGGNGGNAKSFVNSGTAWVVNASNHIAHSKEFTCNARNENVGVIATGDCHDGTVYGDACRSEYTAVEADAGNGFASEVFTDTAKSGGVAVDDDDIMTFARKFFRKR